VLAARDGAGHELIRAFMVLHTAASCVVRMEHCAHSSGGVSGCSGGEGR